MFVVKRMFFLDIFMNHFPKIHHSVLHGIRPHPFLPRAPKIILNLTQ